uniref:Uncharacterized protein n=1 Tax=Anguilla anguilla TaxID=7936 RepID=A0A0E9U487_ANGAN
MSIQFYFPGHGLRLHTETSRSCERSIRVLNWKWRTVKS